MAHPLVLKGDNGSAFISEQLKDLLRTRRILPLYSPPGTPSYNAACETGNRQIKKIAGDLRLPADVDPR